VKFSSNTCSPTSLQQAGLTLSLLAPNGGHYIQQLVCDWNESLQIDCWKKAWIFVAERHEVLRASFYWDDTSEITQRFEETITLSFEVRSDASAVLDRGNILSDFLQADRTRGFNLVQAPLWRINVFIWNGQESTTVWTFHHALLDGRSHAIVWKEVNEVYQDLLKGKHPALPPAKSFQDFTTWLAEKPTDLAESFWREQLRNFQTATALPTLWALPDSWDDKMPPTMETLELTADMAAHLREAADRHGVTLNNLFQGAWALLLGRYQAVEEVVFGVVRSGRHWTMDDPNGRVGMFINTVPFRVNASPSQSVVDWLQGLRSQQFAIRVGEHASLDQIRRWVDLPKNTALFHTCLMFENRDPAELMTNLRQAVRLVEKTDLPTLAVYAGSSITLALDYSPRCYPSEQIQTILRHLLTLLESLASATGDLTLREINMFSEEDRRLVLNDWQGPVNIPATVPFHRALEALAEKTPDAPAVEFLDKVLTYSQLNYQANQLARRLLQFCSLGDRIAVVLDRSLEQPVVWLAALKAGLVYAPVDPANPRERLEFYCDDLQPAVLLTQTQLLPHLPAGSFRVICLDASEEQESHATLDAGNLDFDPPPDLPAYMLFTSGSTGLPKATINKRSGLENFALELKRTFDFGPKDRVLQSSSTSFDASLLDFVAALQSGATLVIVPSTELRPGQSLSRMLSEKHISVSVLTPTVMRSTPIPDPPILRVLISGGEPLTEDLLPLWSRGRRVFNVYGPTECSIYFTFEESKPDGKKPSIGKLIANCRGYILTEAGQPVPVGVPGELYLGGAGVGLGYWRREKLTQQTYLEDQFAGKPNAVMYRTGDRARWLADGRIEYLGRLDSQVKAHGMRVELGEIENVMRGHPGVADSAVVLHDNRLIAWFVSCGTELSDVSMRSWLADRIPQVLAPAEFHAVSQFPRTLTGKTDRAALLTNLLATKARQETSSLAELTAEERSKVLEDWNATLRPYPLHNTVVDFFQEQVRKRPNATALKSGKKHISFSELNSRANRIAHKLLREGLQPEDIVALRFERSMAFVVSALAVLKAGGSYLPLDAKVPVARQKIMLEDSGVRFALMAKEFLVTLTDWNGWSMVVDDDQQTVDNIGNHDPDLQIDPRHRAYVIFTSGSTGRPKGVEIEHHSLTNLVCFYQERLQLTPADCSTLLANTAFDASVADLWPVLCTGGMVLIPNQDILNDPDGLILWLAEEGATFSFVPTALGELMFGRPWPEHVALRFLCVGGEALRARPLKRLPFIVLNTYGPTENTVDSTWEIVLADGAGLSDRPGIGRPIANVRAYVLNGELKPVAVGMEGELFLAGEQVARGYINNPQLTSERFLADPFDNQNKATMYRTGDRVRWRCDGSLEFLGRRDDQVQVRGNRVELGEIEAVLLGHHRVQAVCCRPLFDPKTKNHAYPAHGVAGVAAHLVMPGIEVEKATQELKLFLEMLLPDYMVPAIFILHPELPLTAQGKTDRLALDAAVTRLNQHPSDGSYTVPVDSLDRAITELWHRILPAGVDSRSDQTFHELGGDSLGALRLLLGVEEITGRRMALSTFLLEPTLAGLCRSVAAGEDESKSSLLAFRRKGTRPPLFCLYGLDGDVGSYFDLAAELGDDQPVFGIRSSCLHNLENVPDSIETAAHEIRYLLKELHLKGPFALVGFSWAGLLAFELARQYAEEEGFNPFCGLFGTYPPARRHSAKYRIIHAMRHLPTWVWDLIQDRGQRWDRLRKAVGSSRFLAPFRTVSLIIPDWASSPIQRKLIRLTEHYQPSVACPIPICLFRDSDSYKSNAHPLNSSYSEHLDDNGWGYWAHCHPDICWLDGEHATMLSQPQVKQTATQLRAALEKAFSADQSRCHPQ